MRIVDTPDGKNPWSTLPRDAYIASLLPGHGTFCFGNCSSDTVRELNSENFSFDTFADIRARWFTDSVENSITSEMISVVKLVIILSRLSTLPRLYRTLSSVYIGGSLSTIVNFCSSIRMLSSSVSSRSSGFPNNFRRSRITVRNRARQKKLTPKCFKCVSLPAVL